MKSCIIVGAGITGLVAATTLRRHSKTVTLLEKNGEPGGRMATVEAGEAVFDAGAQYFAAGGRKFTRLVEEWQRAGVVRQWGEGFESGDKRMKPDGIPRYCGWPNMSAVPRHLAHGLDLRLNTPVCRIDHQDGAWRVGTESGESAVGDSVILTLPLPQSIELLRASDLALPSSVRDALDAIEFDPCIALLVELDGPSRIPQPGGLRMPSDEILWMADNHAKGISPKGHGVTIHAGPHFSREYLDADDGLIKTLLLGAAHEWLGSAVHSASVLRWRYSQPTRCFPHPCLVVPEPRPMVLAGDAFGSPRVEGAVLSGLAAAEALLQGS